MDDPTQPWARRGRLPVVVVVGAGFGGMKAVLALKSVAARVVLIDQRNFHLFQPLLYQVATAALSPADIAHPIRNVFRRQRNVSVVMSRVSKIDLDKREVSCGSSPIKYDYLVLAPGSTHSYFGKDDWQQHAPGLKTIDDAVEIRRRMLLAFEEAEYEADEASRRAKLTFVVVGGGPTGVEMAGALREIAAQDIQRDFRNIDTTTTRVILVQSGDRLLPAMHPKLGERAKRDLKKLGVEIRFGSRVTSVDARGVWIGKERLDCENIVWAAGVQASPLARELPVEKDKSGRILVNPDCSLPGRPEVFVVGDAAALKDERTGELVPGLAPAAMQMGRFAAGVIRTEIALGRVGARPAFHYFDKGTLATIGKARAVGDVRGFKFYGFVAWMVWCFVHLMFLVSFRNRFAVMMGWLYDYLLGGREARLITGDADARLCHDHVVIEECADPGHPTAAETDDRTAVQKLATSG